MEVYIEEEKGRMSEVCRDMRQRSEDSLLLVEWERRANLVLWVGKFNVINRTICQRKASKYHG